MLRAGRRRVRTVYLSRRVATSPVVTEIVSLASAAGVPVRRVDETRVDEEAQTDAAQGVVARADPLPEAALDDLLGAPDALLVALDGVTDPRNVGAVVRSALAAGATGMILTRHRSALLTPSAVKAAAGAIEHLPIALVPGVAGALERAGRAGVWTVGLDAAGAASIHSLEVADRPLALVLGAEGRGLGRLARQRCDVVARIPMQGAIASLNVSAAAAVACFEIARQRGQ